MKSKFEVLSLSEIEQRYPNEWVLIEVTKVDKTKGPLSGRVLAHSHDRRDLVRVNRVFCEQNPQRMTYVFFAGPVAPEGYTVVV